MADTAESSTPQAPRREPAIRVSTLELFFDLVFVLTITRLTEAITEHFDVTGLLQVLLVFWLIWWMYGGYAWLTNAVAPSSTARRTLLFAGMAGFLLMALAIPAAFEDTGWLFGLGYLLVNLVHSGLFLQADNSRSVRGALSLAPFNLASALLVVAGGFLPVPYRPVLWVAAAVLQLATPCLHRMEWHEISAGHFAERHGLVVIIAIGESLIALKEGIDGVAIGGEAVLTALLALAIAYYLWWVYFSGDDKRAEHVLDQITDPLRKARVALQGWGYAHYPLLLGVVFLAAGLKKAVGHPFESLGWAAALALGGGAALFVLGHAWFLRILRLRGVPHRMIAMPALLATVPLGHVSAVAQLVAIPVIVAVAVIVEDLPAAVRARSTGLHTFGRTGGAAED
jgi:low temperature requirement protein LtrA